MFDSSLEDEDDSLDLTPLIDVVFMLLIFFIMATSFTKPVIDIVLPSAEGSSTPPKKQKELRISVSQEGIYYYKDKPISLEDIAKLLSTNKEDYLNLYVDKNTPFQAFLSLLEQAKLYRNGEFLITTDKQKK